MLNYIIIMLFALALSILIFLIFKKYGFEMSKFMKLVFLVSPILAGIIAITMSPESILVGIKNILLISVIICLIPFNFIAVGRGFLRTGKSIKGLKDNIKETYDKDKGLMFKDIDNKEN